MHTITIGDENLLRFHECFDDKMIFKNDPLLFSREVRYAD